MAGVRASDNIAHLAELLPAPGGGIVDRTLLIEVFFALPGGFFERYIMNNFRRNSARILASQKECYAQKNRSSQ